MTSNSKYIVDLNYDVTHNLSTCHQRHITLCAEILIETFNIPEEITFVSSLPMTYEGVSPILYVKSRGSKILQLTYSKGLLKKLSFFNSLLLTLV